MTNDPQDPRLVIAATRTAAAKGLAEVLDMYLLDDIAAKLTCREADALADFVRAWHGDELADGFLAAHALEDDGGDSHVATEAEPGWAYNPELED